MLQAFIRALICASQCRKAVNRDIAPSNEIPPIPLTTKLRPLIPSEDADKYHTYRQAIKNGIKEPGVTNIAISGPYGSGKSSIIKTFIKNQENKSEYLQISLANFEVKDGDVGQTIEKSVLQQMFYKVESSKIPYSKLKRIIAPESMVISKLILFIMSFSTLLYLMLNPEYLVGIIDNTWMLYGTVFLFLFMAFYGFHRAAALLKNIKLSKIVIKDAEFNLAGEGEGVSLINRHLDEIIYFFEATDYRTLIIEDLDRFDNVAIFEKLRELNTLVNNNDRIKALKGKITFIYAIKDNFFIEENRSKFFDLIVPVVPYINAAGNARDPLVRELRGAGIGDRVISDQLLNNVSKFIHDHRLLVNIVNEYLVYLNEFNPGLQGENKIDLEKLFCMIVYKNFYPADFADLHQSKGWLYDFFNKKKKCLRKALIQKIDSDMETLRVKIEGAEKELLSDDIDLRAAYISKVLRDSKINPTSLQISGVHMTIKEIIEDPNKFEIFAAASSISFHNTNFTLVTGSLVQNVAMYRERLINIQNKAKIHFEELNRQYAALQEKRSHVIGLKMAAMLKENSSEDAFNDLIVLYRNAGFHGKALRHKLESPNILKYFIREGKICEDYATYISYFHEGGALSRSDNDFILKVIEGQKVDPFYSIDKPKLVIEELDKSKFLDPAILNVDIVNEIFSSAGEYRDHAANIFRVLKDHTTAQHFIPKYLGDYGSRQAGFILYFAEYDKNFWNRLESFGLDRDELLFVLENMFEFCEKDTILSQGDLIIDFIYEAGDYLFSRLNEKQSSMLMMLLPEIGRKFIRIDRPIGGIGEKLLFDCIYEFNLYDLNPYMVALMLKVVDGKTYAEGLPDEQIAEYSNIFSSTLVRLQEYVEKNIDAYVQKIYLLTLDNEVYSESYDSILKLLNHETLDIGLKCTIVESMQTVIENIEKINFDEEVYSALISKFKISPTWGNICEYINSTSLSVQDDKALMEFITNEDMAKQIAASDKKIPDNLDEELLDKAIIFSSYTESSIMQIYRLCIMPFEDISDIGDVSARIIVDAFNEGFISVTRVNFEFLREVEPSLHIKLLEHDFKKAMDFIFELEFDENDAAKILTSDNINIIDRYQYLCGLDISKLPDDHNMTAAIATVEYALKDNPIAAYKAELFEITSKSLLTIDSKIELFLKYADSMANDAVYQFLADLGGQYAMLIPSGTGTRQFNFVKNRLNKKLFEVLRERDLVGKVDGDGDKIAVNKNKNMR
ncbi:hypothetical protein E0765_11170 [Sulfuricurvum sp. IAE1]|uniref:YobI family P-loop NTPase n=1 Tax=Sulfuricurvum sp. IAE1 TaxID=2546102 RepID=UPI0010465DD5|nr:hypothetical protein [Sulfuricurvum sp. IAE1]TDA62372.1 hypothetical protein E0765_11170 [Sulfuricurvum sp. IAE1]